MCRIVAEEGLHLDVASGGELYTALSADFPPERLVFHGNNKSIEELEMALEAGVGRIVIDNDLEIDLLERLTADRERAVPVALRVSPGIDPDTHELISTGQVDTKFGFDIGSGAAMRAVERVHQSRNLDLKGAHCQIGSQLMDLSAHLPAIDQMLDFAKEARDSLGVEFGEINLGGGLGIRYTAEDEPPSMDEFAAQIVERFASGIQSRGLNHIALWQEPGRSIVGDAGTTLYRIGAHKDIPGIRSYVCIDGGMSDNIRPGLYSSQYSALVANKANLPADQVVTISGKHCETDTLIKDASIQQTEPGDILAVQCTGAYNYSMASNYNRMPRPAVVAVSKGEARVIVARESYEDVIRKDLG
jgi:diaminopimelate decarboxylase